MTRTQTPNVAPRTTLASWHAGASRRFSTLSKAVHRHTILVLTVFLSFLLRLVLSDRHSYWLDELFSMESYLLLHDSASSAIRYLMDVSIHPPAYNAVLYYWVEVFGSTETATRSLSNVYVTIAVIVLHRLAHRFHGLAVANAVAIIFALSYTVTYLGLETRSYAQTLLLVTLSSYALFGFLERLVAEHGPRRLLPGWPGVLFLVINAALLLTHYYNLFFWAAQAIFAAALLLLRGERSKRIAALPALVSAYLLQLLVFLLVSGRSAYSAIAGKLQWYEVDVPQHTPLDIVGLLVSQNLWLGPIGGALGLLVMVGLVAWRISERRGQTREGSADDVLGSAHALWMSVGPVLIAYVAFLVLGSERSEIRFYASLVPYLVLVTVLAASQLLVHVVAVVRRQPLVDARRHVRRHALAYTLALVAVLVVPGTLAAASQPKENWRGLGQDVVDMVTSNPDLAFAIYEPGFRWEPMFDHYLRRFSNGDIAVTGVIRIEEEFDARDFGDEFQFERDHDFIAAHDRLVLPFAHHRIDEFPIALRRLRQTYGEPFEILDDDGRGLLMFDLSDVD